MQKGRWKRSSVSLGGPSVVHTTGKRAISICSLMIQTLPLFSVPFSSVLYPYPILIPAFIF